MIVAKCWWFRRLHLMFCYSPNANPHLTNNLTIPGGRLATDLENMVNSSATSKSTPSTPKSKSAYTKLSDLDVIDPEPGFELTMKDEELEGLFTVMPSSDQITQKSLADETMSSSPDPPLSHPQLKSSSTNQKGSLLSLLISFSWLKRIKVYLSRIVSFGTRRVWWHWN